LGNVAITRKERKSRELYNAVSEEYIPPRSSRKRDEIDRWVDEFSDDAEFDLSSYAECFISENLLRKYIKYNKVDLSEKAKIAIREFKNKESTIKSAVNISYEIRENMNELLYLDMDSLANLVDKPTDPNKNPGISRDAKVYKPLRDAVAHTSILTTNAKSHLNITFENIKARLKQIIAD
jgi:hypothetical protein